MEVDKVGMKIQKLCNSGRRCPCVLDIDTHQTGTSWSITKYVDIWILTLKTSYLPQSAIFCYFNTQILETSISDGGARGIDFPEMDAVFSDGVKRLVIKDGSFNIDDHKGWKLFEKFDVKVGSNAFGISKFYFS